MATQLKISVKPSGGDVSSLAAAIAYLQNNYPNLVTADRYADIEIDGDWSGGADSSSVTITGITTDATHYINIYTTAAARHSGKWSTSKYRLYTWMQCITFNAPFVYVTGLQLRSQASNPIYDQAGIHGTIYISKNYIEADASTQCLDLFYPASDTVWKIYDNVIVNGTYGVYEDNGGYIHVYNNTFHGQSTAGVRQRFASGFYVKNNLFDNCAVDASGTITDSYNSTTNDDTKGLTASGANNRFSQGANFSFTDATNHDFSLTSSDAGAKDYGVSDPGSGLFSDDILSNARSGSWDIGAFEYVSTDTSKTVTDSGSGSDSIASVAVSLSISDSGAGADSFGGGVTAAVPLSETGHGSDSITQILASLLLSDTGHGADSIAQLLASMTVSDAGHGTDALGNIAAQVPVSESGTGIDAIAQILASLSVSDTGQGTDAALALILVAIPDSGTGADSVYQIAVSAAVQEAGQGIDQVAQISATVSLTDTAQGVDAPQILATVSVPDSGTGLDLITVLSEALKAIADTGVGVDAVSSIAVVVPVADVGSGVDFLGTIEALLHVLDMGRGTEIVIRQMDTRLIAEIRFKGKPHPRFDGAPRIGFTGRKYPKFKA